MKKIQIEIKSLKQYDAEENRMNKFRGKHIQFVKKLFFWRIGKR
jgi:hypothetical protein